MPALVLLGRQLLIAADDVPLFALPAALFHSAWTIVLIVTLALYQRHPVCRDEGDYLPFLAGGAAAFAISSALQWSLFKVGVTGTPLETHARRAVPFLLYLHSFASLAELGIAAYGAHLLHVDTRLCIAWSPRPMAATLVGTTWAVIALNGLLTALALNPWHGLGLVEAWEARLLWLARLLCCRLRLLTHTRIPDREPALRRIAQLTSHLLQHVDLTLSDVAAAMILVAAAQRERRRRALRDAMVAAAAAHSVLLGSGAGATGLGVGLGSISGLRPSSLAGSGSVSASAGPQVAGVAGSGSSETSAGCPGIDGHAAAAVLSQGGERGHAPGMTAGGSFLPFLAVQQSGPSSTPLPQQNKHQLQQHLSQHSGRQLRVRFAEDGTELAAVHTVVEAAGVKEAAAAFSEAFCTSNAVADGLLAAPPASGGILPSVDNTSSLVSESSYLLGPTPNMIVSDGGVAAGILRNSTLAADHSCAGYSAPLQLSTGARTGLSGGSSSRLSLLGMGAADPASAVAREGEGEQPPSPSRALALMHPIVHITPAGMEEHLDELVGELVVELAAEAAEAEGDGGSPAEGGLLNGADGSMDLDATLDLDLRREGSESTEPGAVRLRSVGSATQEPVAAAAGEVLALDVAPVSSSSANQSRRIGSAAGMAGSSPLSPSLWASIRKSIGDAALAAAFAAEREMVDRETLQEAAVYGRYAAAIYGSCPPDGPSKSAAWHLGGDGDGSSPDEVAAWRRRHGSSAPDPLLASILSSASKCTEHVVHVNTHNSAEGYLPYMVCLDKPTKSVVIAIRGTFSAEDIVTDCLCEPLDVRHLLSRDVTPPAATSAPTAATAASTAAAAPSSPEAVVETSGAIADPLTSKEAAEATAAAAEAFNAAIKGVPSNEAVLVHAGIWAAADVIWEDLRQLRLLEILLPPPGASPADGQSSAPKFRSNWEITPPPGATAAAAVAPVTDTREPHGSRSTSSNACPPSDSTTHPNTDDSNLPRQAVQRPSQLRPSPQPQPPQRPPQGRSTANNPPPHSNNSQQEQQTLHQLQRQQKQRRCSLDEATASGSRGSQLAAPPPAALRTGGSHAAAVEPWACHSWASFDVSGPSHSFVGPHLPRLISAERQATMPHDNGLSGLLRRHQRLPPPPPPPAAALLPSLVLSYHPPALTASMPSAAGAAGSRREVLPSSLRRGKSTTATTGRRRRGAAGGGGGSSCGKSSGGDGDDDDNDPRAPLLSSPAGAPPAGTPATGDSPVDTALQATRYSPSRFALRHSGDFGFMMRRGFDKPGTGDGASPSGRHADTGCSSSSQSPQLPAPATAASRRPLLSASPPALLPPRGVAYPRCAGPDGAATVSALSASRHGRAFSVPSLRGSGIVHAAIDNSLREGAVAAVEHDPPGILRRMGQAVSGALQTVSALVHQPQQSPPPLPPHQQVQQRQRWVSWLSVQDAGARPASEGGAPLPYVSLPRTEPWAQEQPGVLGSAHRSARRWRSAGGMDGCPNGGGSVAAGADGGVMVGWSISGPDNSLSFMDVEAGMGAAASSMLGSGGDESQEEPTCGDAASSDPLRVPEVDCTAWRLVVTGHSLGAGAAALLALRLRSALPHVEVRCWAFSPPGSLTSPALSEALRPFTVSVVTGKDLIPRLSLNTMERYRDEMITALARCRCSKARVLVGSFSRINRLRRAAHLLLPYNEIPDQAQRLLRSYHEAVHRAGRLPELHPPGRILYLQPSARSGEGVRRGQPGNGPAAASGTATSTGVEGGDRVATAPARASASGAVPHYRPVWISARELLSEGILASTRMLVDHSLTLCTLPALDEILST